MSFITPCAAPYASDTACFLPALDGMVVDKSMMATIVPAIDAVRGASVMLPSLTEVDLSFDPKERILWQYMKPEGRPSFTCGLLRDMKSVLDFVEQTLAHVSPSERAPIGYIVMASAIPTIFNLGGDLPFFVHLIETQNRQELSRYARICAHGQHRRATNMNLPLCSIALVQGDALGGGFEGALAQDVIIAERRANFGLPEVLFNMFPGMGALSFLSRRIGLAQAERMILSGKVYTAEELLAMGVIDAVVDDGQGVDAVYEHVRMFERAPGMRHALLKARKIVQPIPLQELIDIADLWVEAALSLSPSDLRRMRHLAKAQDRRWQKLSTVGERAVG